MWHRHRWDKWGEIEEASRKIWPSQLETMMSRNWAGVAAAQPIQVREYVQRRRCEACGEIQIRTVTV